MNIIQTSFIQYRQWLVNYVCKQVDDYDLAEDIVQDAFLRLLEMQVGVRADSVKNLLFTTCRHLAYDHLRRKMLAERTDIYMYAQEESTVSADQLVRVREIAEHEWRMVNAMPKKQRHVYCLSRYEGRSIVEIATQLHISPRTVEAHLFAGRKAVREHMSAFAS